MTVVIKTKAEIGQWLNEVQQEFDLDDNEFEVIVGTGLFSNGQRGYALEVRVAGGGQSLAGTPISKMLFEHFRPGENKEKTNENFHA